MKFIDKWSWLGIATQSQLKDDVETTEILAHGYTVKLSPDEIARILERMAKAIRMSRRSK